MSGVETIGVLDASALIAFLRDEPGADVVQAVLHNGAIMSAVNVSEVLASLATLDRPVDELYLQLTTNIFGDMLRIVPFDGEFARATARLRPLTRHAGLSLGDRACLALAQRSNAPALTADRRWTEVASAVGVTIRLIRL